MGEPVALMLREKSKWQIHKGESTDARHWGGAARSSDEVSVMEMEQRGCVRPSNGRTTQKGRIRRARQNSLELPNGSRMTREGHVRFCEKLVGKFHRLTHPAQHFDKTTSYPASRTENLTFKKYPKVSNFLSQRCNLSKKI